MGAAGFHYSFNLFQMINQIFVLQSVDMLEDIEGEFYVIEKFPYPCFVTDENGEIKTYSIYADAKAEADSCQQGFVLIF